MQSTQEDSLKTYRETQVKTASQGSLIIMLYDEVLKRVRRAMDLLEQTTSLDPKIENSSLKDVESVSNHLVKAQDVITELMVSLDFERGGEIARNLFSIYITRTRPA